MSSVEIGPKAMCKIFLPSFLHWKTICSYVCKNLMQELTEIWGVKENIAPLEIAARAFVMFFIALALIRISGMRAFGSGSAFDNIIVFLIGAILSRGVIAATP